MGCLQATEAIKLILNKEGICSGRVLTFDALKMKFGEVGLAKRENREVITELIDYQGFCAGPKTAKAEAAKLKNDQSTVESVLSAVDDDSDHAPTSFELLKAKAAPRNGKKFPTSAAVSSSKGRTMDEAESAVTNTLEEDAFHSIDPKKCLDKLVSGWTPWVLDVRLPTEHDIVALPFTDRVVPHRTVQLEHVPKSGDILVYCKAGVRGKKACNKLVELGVEADRLYNLDGGIMRWQKEVDTSMPRY
jgi:sulfur-carrier protein adenylyltransferase/sulfurtransferase